VKSASSADRPAIPTVVQTPGVSTTDEVVVTLAVTGAVMPSGVKHTVYAVLAIRFFTVYKPAVAPVNGSEPIRYAAAPTLSCPDFVCAAVPHAAFEPCNSVK